MAASASKPELTKDMAHTVAPHRSDGYQIRLQFSVLTGSSNTVRVAGQHRHYGRVRIEATGNQKRVAFPPI
jgi:hypothetical protein